MKKRMNTLSQLEISQKLARIKQTFVGIPVVIGKNGYPYSFFTLTDFVPPMDPTLVEDMADLIVYSGNFEDADIIVSEADRGAGPLVHAIAVRTNLPYILANWYPTELTGETRVKASIGFSGEGCIYLNGLKRNQKVILVDDILSSGGTAAALLEAIEEMGAIPIQAMFVAEKLGQEGRELIENKFDTPIDVLVQFKVEGNVTSE